MEACTVRKQTVRWQMYGKQIETACLEMPTWAPTVQLLLHNGLRYVSGCSDKIANQTVLRKKWFISITAEGTAHHGRVVKASGTWSSWSHHFYRQREWSSNACCRWTHACTQCSCVLYWHDGAVAGTFPISMNTIRITLCRGSSPRWS